MEVLINEFIADKCLFVVTCKNELKSLYCPFLVSDNENKIQEVTSIAPGNGSNLYYRVNGKYQIHSEFIII